MKIVIVSNKPDLEEDYSEFVDSCDVVVRINKLDSITYEKTGKKTDITFISAWLNLYIHPDAFKHIDYIRNSIIYITEEQKYNTNFIELIKNKISPNKDFIIYQYYKETTLNHAIDIISKRYPNEKIYYIGDKSTFIRTGHGHKQSWFHADSKFNILEENGVLIPIINNENYLEIWIKNGIYTGFYLIKNKKEIFYNKNSGILEPISNNIYKILWNNHKIEYLDINNKVIKNEL